MTMRLVARKVQDRPDQRTAEVYQGVVFIYGKIADPPGGFYLFDQIMRFVLGHFVGYSGGGG